MALLPVLLKQEMPPGRVRDRLLSRISARKAEPPPPAKKPTVMPEQQAASVPGRQRPWMGYALIALLIVVIAVLGVFINDLIGTIGGQERRVVELQGELQRKDEVLSVLRSDRLEVVLLNGLGPSPAARGKILWDPDQKNAIVQITGLPVTPPNNEYQLWMMRSGRLSSVGTFSLLNEKEGESFFKAMSLTVGQRQEIDGFTVTLEPKGGSAQPTGLTYLRGVSR
jgi:hypothetical protein